MNWTKEKPKVAGYYWICQVYAGYMLGDKEFSLDVGWIEPEHNRVVIDGNKWTLSVDCDGDYFMGPIPEPMFPAGVEHE